MWLTWNRHRRVHTTRYDGLLSMKRPHFPLHSHRPVRISQCWQKRWYSSRLLTWDFHSDLFPIYFGETERCPIDVAS